MYLLLAVIHGEESSIVHVQGCERRTLSSACPELQGLGRQEVPQEMFLCKPVFVF